MTPGYHVFVSKLPPSRRRPSPKKKVLSWRHWGEYFTVVKVEQVVSVLLKEGFHVQVFDRKGRLWKDLYGEEEQA